MNSSNARLGFVGKLKDLACLGSYVTIHNNRSVLIESCQRIYDCSEITVRVGAGDYYIEVWGKDLNMSQYTQDSVEISGVIDSVKLTAKDFGKRER